MKLIHKTNYMGKWIDAKESNGDDEVDFDAIWVQVLRDGESPCCHGFGKRSVYVDEYDFEREDDGWWSLFLVSEREGDDPYHYFYKFVAIPHGYHGYGRKGCERRGWIHKGSFFASDALPRLEDLFEEFFDEADNDYEYDINHFHLGIWMETLFAG